MEKISTVCRELKTLGKVKVLAGVSGGADSIALLLLLLRAGVNVLAVHFEHGIRGAESVEDAEFVKQFCLAHNVESIILPLNVMERMKPGENLEAAARRMRLEEWRRLALEFPGSVVALGHHRDDAVENFLLRFARGGNLTSLTNLRARKELNGLCIIRPLLKLSRAEIEEFLHESGVDDFRTDSTNLEDSYQRNFLRNNVLKLWRQKFLAAEHGWEKSLEALNCDADFLLEQAEALAQSVKGEIVTPLSFWKKLHPAMLPRVVDIYLNGGSYFTAGRLKQLAEFLNSAVSTGCFKLDGKLWIKERGQLILSDPPDTVACKPVLWNWRDNLVLQCFGGEFSAIIHEESPDRFPRDPWRAWFRLAQMPDMLEITAWHPGDDYVSFGGMHRKLKALFRDKKLGVLQKRRQPVVKSNGTVIWIPGVDNTGFARVVHGEPAVEFIFCQNR